MNAAERIIQEMPEQFTRKQVMACAKQLGYSYSTANAVVDKMLYQDLAERVRNGLYRKLETEPEPEYEYEDEPEYWEDEEIDDEFV